MSVALSGTVITTSLYRSKVLPFLSVNVISFLSMVTFFLSLYVLAFIETLTSDKSLLVTLKVFVVSIVLWLSPSAVIL
jgi:hypothetical protein